MTELRPCPFCGSRNVALEWEHEGCAVWCKDCGCSTRLEHDEETIIAVWNKRTLSEDEIEFVKAATDFMTAVFGDDEEDDDDI